MVNSTKRTMPPSDKSTTVEIYMVNSTRRDYNISIYLSTTVEIYMVNSTDVLIRGTVTSTTVEIYMVNSTIRRFLPHAHIYNSRNLYGQFDSQKRLLTVINLQQ